MLGSPARRASGAGVQERGTERGRPGGGEVPAPRSEPQPWSPALPVLEDAGGEVSRGLTFPLTSRPWNRTHLPGGAGSERAVPSRGRFPNWWDLFPIRGPAVRPLLWDSWTPAVTFFHFSCICHWNSICLSLCFPRETSLIRTAAPVRLLYGVRPP